MHCLINFVSDPKFIIPVAISLISLFWSYYNQQAQDRRWEILNRANVELTKTRFVLSKGFTAEEANQKGFWGYNLSFHRDDSDNLYKITSTLAAFYMDTKKPIHGFNSVFRLSEALEQLKAKGINNNYIILKHFVVAFQFENLGKTDANNVKIKISVENPNDKAWQDAFEQIDGTDLTPGVPIYSRVGYNLPLDMPHPSNINYKIELSYKDDNNNEYLKTFKTTYDSENNAWSYKKVI